MLPFPGLSFCTLGDPCSFDLSILAFWSGFLTFKKNISLEQRFYPTAHPAAIASNDNNKTINFLFSIYLYAVFIQAIPIQR